MTGADIAIRSGTRIVVKHFFTIAGAPHHWLLAKMERALGRGLVNPRAQSERVFERQQAWPRPPGNTATRSTTQTPVSHVKVCKPVAPIGVLMCSSDVRQLIR
jgi:hypothetical protein